MKDAILDGCNTVVPYNLDCMDGWDWISPGRMQMGKTKPFVRGHFQSAMKGKK